MGLVAVIETRITGITQEGVSLLYNSLRLAWQGPPLSRCSAISRTLPTYCLGWTACPHSREQFGGKGFKDMS